MPWRMVSSCQYLPWITDVKLFLRVALDVLPDVEHGSASGIDERATEGVKSLELVDRDAECGEDHDVGRAEFAPAFVGVAQEADALRAQLIVDVRIVDDLPGQEDLLRRKALASLVRVVDRAIDAVAKAEFAGKVHGEPAGFKAIVLRLDVPDQLAVVTVGQNAGHFVLEVEALAEDQRRHYCGS